MKALEDAFYGLAKSTGEPAVLLCDRGAMDGSAYMDPEGLTLALLLYESM